MLQLYDLNKVKIKGLKLYKDYCIESTLSTGDKVLSFLYPSQLSKEVLEECYIRTKTAEFVVKEIADKGDWKSIKAVLNVEDLEGKEWEHFDTTEQTVEQCLNLALAGTGWTVQVNGVTKIRTIRKTNCSTWDIIQQVKKTYLVEIEFDTINKIVKVYEKIGSDKGVYFMDSLNLRCVDIQSNSYDFYTRLVAIGKDNLKVTVENFQYSNKKKTFLWKDERYTNVESLTEDATAKLEELSKPRKAYSADVIDLASISNKYSILSYSLGDTITLVSKEKGIKEKQRIVKIKEYPDEPSRNTCEIANTFLSFADIQREYQDTLDTVNNITSDNGTICEGAVRTAVEYITINKADITDLNAATARIGTLEVTTATITQLNAATARISTLEASSATITQLNAATGRITILESKAASIDTLLTGNLTAANMQANFITAASGLIANGAIKDAMILDCSIDKLKAGNISTNKFVVTSDSGNLKIQGNTLKVWDNSGKERVSLGLNGSDYNLLVRGADGSTVLFGVDGVTNAGITAGAVDDSKVAVDANINGSKIEKESLVTQINGATTTLKASKIKLDTENQTLEIAFTTLTNIVTNTNNAVSNQGTAISTLQGQISSKIWQQDITIAVNNVQVGVRNLILNSNTRLETGAYKIGEVQLSCDIQDNTVLTITAWGALADGQQLYVGLYPSTENLICLTKNSNGTYQGTFKFNKKISCPDDVRNRLVLYNYPMSGNLAGHIDKLKLELGNKPTDWTPAPEDTDEQIATISTNYSNINQTLNSISANVGTLQSTTSKLVTRMSSAEGSLNVLQNQISLKVTQTDINNAINNIQIGGRNLLRNTDFEGTTGIFDIYDIGTNAGTIIVVSTDCAYHGTSSLKYTKSGADRALCGIIGLAGRENLAGKTLTFSIKVRGVGSSIGKAVYANIYDNYTGGLSGQPITLTDSWQTAKVTLTIPLQATAVYVYWLSTQLTAGDIVYADCAKLEEGNKNTDWTEAPEDTQGQIDSVTTRISTAESNINQLSNSISFKVNTTDYNSKMSILDGSISSLTSRISDAELKITSDTIVSTVRTSSAYSGDLSAKVSYSDLSSQIQQRAGDIQVAFNNISSNIKTYSGQLNIINGAINVKSSDGKIGLSIEPSGYTYNEWGMKTTTANKYTIYAGNGSVLANGNDDALFRPYGFFHEPADGKHTKIMTKNGLDIVNLDNSAYMSIYGGWVYGQQFRATDNNGNAIGAVVRDNDIDSITGRLWLNYYGGIAGNTSKVLVGSGMADGTYGELHCGSFYAHGSKNRLVETSNYGSRALSAVECAYSIFEDYGRAKIINGQCIINIEPIWLETVNTNIQYEVNTWAYGKGFVWVETAEMFPSYFIVRGDTDIEFGYKIIAKQKGYENTRLELVAAQ